MFDKFFYVYVLLSLKDKKFYIDYTNDIERRLLEHQRGENISTAKRLPVTFIYFEAFRSKQDALCRENYFKTSKGKTTLRQMIRENLHDLRV